MKQFDSLLYTLGQISEHAREYLDNQKSILRLEVAQKTSQFLSRLIGRIIIFIFIIFLILFGSLTLSIGLSIYFNSFLWGFGTVTIIYLLMIWIVYLFRHKLITNPILNMILKDLND